MTTPAPAGPGSREGELPATVRAPTALPATVRALGWTSFLTDLSSEAIYPLLPAFVKGLGGTGVDIGLIDGLANAVAAVVRLFAGTLSDRLGRRPTFAILCLATIAAALWLYQGHDSFGTSFLVAAFLAGGVSASFYGLFPLYFPELFPTAVRATGQGFALNFGRIIAAIGGLQTAALMGYFGGSFPKAGSVLVAIYLVGAVIVWFGPETKGRPLPE